MREVDVAYHILSCNSDRDVLGLSQAGPLTREGIQKAFHARALCLHPDKFAAAKASTSRSTSAVVAAFGKLVEARDRLLELLPLSQLVWQQQQHPQVQPCFEASERSNQHTGFAVFDTCAVAPLCAEPYTSPSPGGFNMKTAATSSPLANLEAEPFSSSLGSVKCCTFGCLRTMSVEDMQAYETVCLYCRTKPHKCATFGCLRLVTGSAHCSEHQL